MGEYLMNTKTCNSCHHDDDDCVDCGVNCIEINEYYMVTNGCWGRAKMASNGGMLCIGCLEKRLGKKLTPRNFIDCPLNWRNICIPEHASPRLISRLLGGPKSKWRIGALQLLQDGIGGDIKPLEEKLLISIGGEDAR